MEGGLKESEVVSFLKLLGSSKAKVPRIDPIGLSLKMLKICIQLIEAGTLPPFSLRWPKSATISSLDYLIQNSLAFRKTENESSLSLADILEENVPEKYFLSKEQMEKVLSNS